MTADKGWVMSYGCIVEVDVLGPHPKNPDLVQIRFAGDSETQGVYPERIGMTRDTCPNYGEVKELRARQESRLSLVDCSAHDPGMGVMCYRRPDWEIVGTVTGRAPIPHSHACTAHLGEVIASIVPTDASPQTVAVVNRYEGA